MKNKNNNSVTDFAEVGWFDQSFELKSIERVKENP